jgi:hypothetical protein
MIIVKLMGGLGNQLFQYAFGRAMSLKHHTQLKFDLSFFEGNRFRKYELGNWGMNAAAATSTEIEDLKKKHFSTLSTYKRKLLKTKANFVHEKGPLFNPAYFYVHSNAYIDGYWQSENYFISAAAQVMEDLYFNTAPSLPNQQMLSRIEQSNAVSIHVRRGDYVENAHANIHGVCSLNYYIDAVNYIAKQVTRPVFYFFSDDMDWVKQNFDLPYQTVFVDINDGDAAYDDLRLISACKHHIIANSSFSWWGAWLNPHSNKMVIAPKQWFSDAELNAKATAITPKSWVRL